MTGDLEIARLNAVLRQDFGSFLRKAFHTLSPGQEYVRGWHLDAIVHRLQQVHIGETKRLVINMPPRSLKSIAASVALPAFILGHDPTRRIICVSYSTDLAKKHSNDFRAIIESDWYCKLFPQTRIGLYKNTENEIELTERGYRIATSVGGTLTGRGGDLIIIDDPLKPIDALSESRRGAVNQWYANTLLSRLDDKRTGAIIIVMQCVHIDDLTGFVLAQQDEWSHLTLPAIAEHDEAIVLGRGRYYHRQAGEPLSQQREPVSVLEELRRQLGSDVFSAQYQQAPVPPGGAMIKRHWVQRYSELPPENRRLMILQSWDSAAKGGPDNDWSVCTTWMQTRDRQWYLLDVWRARVDYPSLKVKVAELARRWEARQVLIEESGTAIGLLQELKFIVPGVTAIKTDRDKVTRMSLASATFEAGQVHLPTRAAWLAELEAELFAFPGSSHDDQVDSISQAILHGSSGLAVWLKLAGH
jgi:predicted phage terminase large subunit-like protein